jgi:AcrR family transcriptional regulator
MPRPKSYNRHEALELSCRAFWAHGYQSLGVRELEALTGLNQFAIQTEFGGKEGLYLEALSYYSDAAISTAMKPLVDGGLPEIVAFLRNLVTEGSATSSEWGCLIVNTGIENARIGSPRLADAVNYYWGALENHFRLALKNALASEQIGKGADVDEIVDGLVTAVMGVHAKNRACKANDAGKALVEMVCNHLKLLEAS